MWNPTLVHSAVYGLDGLPKGAFQILEMVCFTMMVCHMIGWIMGCALVDMCQITFNQGEHVFCRTLIEKTPLAANRHIDRRRVGENAPIPTIVMKARAVSWPAAARRQPGMTIHFDLAF